MPMSPAIREDNGPTEETALLSDGPTIENGHRGSLKAEPKPITPLPKLQIGILLLLQLAEPITSQCIYPFINQLVSELDITGGDEKKVGYYAGMIESLFFCTEAIFVLQWSRVSDYIGRKPVLLIGTAGLFISMIFFGLSRQFWQLVVSRCLVGALNGNIGVQKSMMGELTDSTNMAQGFSLIPVVWSAGATIGPLIGGQLSKPHDRWPHTFTSHFWIHYPYFLPCAVSAAFSALTFVVAAVLLKETVKTKYRKHVPGTPTTESHDEIIEEHPITLRALVAHRPARLSIAAYVALALLDIAYRALQPLFLSTPLALGGLSQPPATIGAVLGTFGLLNGVLQALFFAPLVRRFGPKRVFMTGMGSFVVLFALFPVLGALARMQGGVTNVVWACVGLQLMVSIVMDMSFGCALIFVTSSAPNKRSLGTINGIGQLLAATMRAVGPASATSFFALSLERNWMGGNAVYLIYIVLSLALFTVTLPLPREAWQMDDTQ
ncbi:MFS general substrate transporter [Wolfiporia cocos MD-104 SS10]|uniref:MFS general substrate transporter n=1 Tax=Wolfiporia cocos (strain MD-104) TaxID=742152 RepID=A0A2H3JJK8_WOLCO|nr:MFS general substrate transporter [Wolfiporia cocos MD-104 SS10]